mmetsp:Transcript_13819/g.11780  ORF Transcript_13819/g.11780 Transcript_13819/m.11780 type:complete len:466 (-) Transcript_13819:8-1405(-)
MDDFSSVEQQADEGMEEEGRGVDENFNSLDEVLDILNSNLAFLDSIRNNLEGFTESLHTFLNLVGFLGGEIVVSLINESSNVFTVVNAGFDGGPVFFGEDSVNNTFSESQDVSLDITNSGESKDGSVVGISPDEGSESFTNKVAKLVPVLVFISISGIGEFVIEGLSVDQEVLSNIVDESLGALQLRDGVPELLDITSSSLTFLASFREDLEGFSKLDDTVEDFLVLSSGDFSGGDGEVVGHSFRDVDATRDLIVSSFSRDTVEDTLEDIRDVLDGDSVNSLSAIDSQSNSLSDVEAEIFIILGFVSIHGTKDVSGDIESVQEDVLGDSVPEGDGVGEFFKRLLEGSDLISSQFADLHGVREGLESLADFLKTLPDSVDLLLFDILDELFKLNDNVGSILDAWFDFRDVDGDIKSFNKALEDLGNDGEIVGGLHLLSSGEGEQNEEESEDFHFFTLVFCEFFFCV